MKTQAEQEADWAEAVAARNTVLAAQAGEVVSVALVPKTIVSGVLNGVNEVFVYDSPPSMIHQNGMCLEQGVDYVQSGNQVTFASAPLSTDILLAL